MVFRTIDSTERRDLIDEIKQIKSNTWYRVNWRVKMKTNRTLISDNVTIVVESAKPVVMKYKTAANAVDAFLINVVAS